MAWNQADDSEVPYPGPRAADRGLTRLGLRHQAWTFPVGGHLAPALRDDWREALPWLDATRVVSDPPRIDYGYYPALDNHHFGLIHDHAYWLSGLRVQPGRARGDVSAQSLAFGSGSAPAVQYTRAAESGGSPATVHGVRWGPVPGLPSRNELQLKLRNLMQIRVSGRGAHLTGRGLTVMVDTNVPTSIRVGLRVCLGGRAHSAWLIHAAPGRHTFKSGTCRTAPGRR
jgi:hypothetical protein